MSIIIFIILLAILLAAAAGGILFKRRGGGLIDLFTGDAAVIEKPRYVDENVLFTVYRPKSIAPEEWYTLLAIAHIAEKRPGTLDSVPEPREVVRQIAKRYYGDSAARQQITQQQSSRGIPEKEMLTLVPVVEGVEFNPESRKFRWLKDVHAVDFDMRSKPGAGADWKPLRGKLTVFAGINILADVTLSIEVNAEKAALPDAYQLFEVESASPYDKIFASYSHKDEFVVEQFEAFVEALGHKYIRDVRDLRSGEVFDERLMRFIDDAQVFQLFWSWNSIDSAYVKKEWSYAISLDRPNFVRPTYWEDPLPKKEGLPPEKLSRLHFYKLRQLSLPAAGQAVHRFRTQPLQLASLLLFGVIAISIFSVVGYFIEPAGVNLNQNVNARVSPTPRVSPGLLEEPEDYSATMVVRTTYPRGYRDREIIILTTKHGGNRLYKFRDPWPKEHEEIALDRVDGRFLLLPENKVYAELRYWNGHIPGTYLPPIGVMIGWLRDSRQRPIDNTVYNERSALIYQVPDDISLSAEYDFSIRSGRILIDEKTGLPLLIEINIRDKVFERRDLSYEIELRDIRLSVDAPMLEIPGDYKKVPENEIWRILESKYKQQR